MHTRQAMRESAVEDYLVERVKQMHGVAEKTISPSARGFFDRIVVLPGGRVIFVEVKKPKGSTVSRHQKKRHRTYQALGAEVAVVKSLADVDRLLTGGVQKGSTPSHGRDPPRSMESK
jgi:RecB family exonuclease